jgi:hypothetical protein
MFVELVALERIPLQLLLGGKFGGETMTAVGI